MTYRWNIKDRGDPETVNRLIAELNVTETIAALLVHRGISTFEEAKKFFRPSLSDLHDPFLMKDMDRAVVRLDEAVRNKEKILVYGDYDVDGTTAVALVYTFLEPLHPNIDFYIPDRYTEGYGISYRGIDFAAENGFSLIIALDCGIKANEKTEYAARKGIDFIICDHHRPGEKIPVAAAVLDPKREDCAYPYKELSGCGIGFKLVQAYSQKNNISFEELEQYLDLVAVSIAADIVPITGENRILAHFGLRQLNSSPRLGFRMLLEQNQIKKELAVSDLVFIIGPRINAAGRIDSGRKAVELLISKEEEAANEWSLHINRHNNERKDLDASITLEALHMIESDGDLLKRKTTVLFNPEWHKGVIGIVASRLIEKYYRPTVLLTLSNGKATGSARSVKNFDIYEAIEECSDLLEQFGGHKHAAGLTLNPENIERFSRKFEEVVNDRIDEDMLVPEIEIDGVIKFSEITPRFYNIIRQFAPFGPGNMKPVFLTEQVVDKGYGKVVGNGHLKMNLMTSGDGLVSFPAIAFRQGERVKNILGRNPFSVCYSIEQDEWNGNKRLQLKVRDMKFT